MNSDKTLAVYPAGGSMDSLTSGAPTFTGDAALIQGCSEVLATVAYKVPDDVGITFTWGLQSSADGVTGWSAIDATTNVLTLSAGTSIFVHVYGYLDNLTRRTSDGFLRIYGVAANFTNDTIEVMGWLNLGRDNGAIMNQSVFRNAFAFDVTDLESN